MQLNHHIKHSIPLLQCWRLFCINGVRKCDSIRALLVGSKTKEDISFPVFLRSVRPDNDFILNYVTYHYYRSKDWVVKDGLKFGVNWSRHTPLLSCQHVRILMYCNSSISTRASFYPWRVSRRLLYTNTFCLKSYPVILDMP